jgi:hypothetical protein
MRFTLLQGHDGKLLLSVEDSEVGAKPVVVLVLQGAVVDKAEDKIYGICVKLAQNRQTQLQINVCE